MVWLTWMVGMAAVGQGPGNTAADVVNLRDGKVVLGQVLDSDRRGPLLVLVRREWAKTHVPERLDQWARADLPAARRAAQERTERLKAWKRDRAANPIQDDRITPWIDAELTRLADPARPTLTTLIVGRIGRNDVKTVVKRAPSSTRGLRLGWTIGVEDVESISLPELKQALEARGYAWVADGPVSVDALLPPQAETDNRWQARRAATELANDPGGRFVRFQDLLLPEPAAGAAVDPGAGLNAAVASIKSMLAENPVDPLPAKLKELASRGRVGAVVTRMDLASDFSGVTVEATFWVRTGPDRWLPAVLKTATANPAALPADAGAPLAEDPQVKAAFDMIQAIGLGEVPPDLKRRGLNMGAATQHALGEVRAALAKDLEALTISLEPPKPAKP